MKNSYALIVLATAVSSLVACGGPCEYRKVQGTCTITYIEDATNMDYVCTADATATAVVRFEFVPASSGADPIPGNRLMIGMGTEYNPPRVFLDANGLTLGSQHPCVREEIKSGSCTPVMYTFDNFDTDNATGQYCDGQ